jgi:ferredoxin
MRIAVDRDRCVGYGLCAETAPDLLELDDDGNLVIAAGELPPDAGGRAASAVRVCPVAALRIIDDAS